MDYMCKELEEDEYSPVLRLAYMHQYKISSSSLKKNKEKIITEEYRKLENRNRKKNNFMDISSDKL